MGIRGRAGVWAVAAGLIAGQAEPAQARVPVAVTIRVDNLAGVPAGDVRTATSEAAQIFRRAGVEIAWAGDDVVPGPGRLMLILTNAGPAIGAEPGDVAGTAARPVFRAYVFCNRVAAVSSHAPVDARVMLGRVIAHEIGHLLLPPDSHSPTGIMRPQIDLSRDEFNGFTGHQVDAIRRALEGMRANN
jgi:hypothetical protein